MPIAKWFVYSCVTFALIKFQLEKCPHCSYILNCSSYSVPGIQWDDRIQVRERKVDSRGWMWFSFKLALRHRKIYCLEGMLRHTYLSSIPLLTACYMEICSIYCLVLYTYFSLKKLYIYICNFKKQRFIFSDALNAVERLHSSGKCSE